MGNMKKNNQPPISMLIREIWRGKSLPRTFLNFALKSITVRGAVLDLGSKSSAMSYNRFLKRGEGARVTYTDYHSTGKDIIKLDLEKSYELRDMSYDTITCFNTLEHVFNYQNLISESYRVLKSGGTFIGGTPFLVGYHPDPHDYFRYTHEALDRMFVAAGFEKEQIVSLGLGPLTAALSMDFFVWPRILRPLAVTVAILFDQLILKIKPKQLGRFPLGYVYVFRKT